MHLSWPNTAHKRADGALDFVTNVFFPPRCPLCRRVLALPDRHQGYCEDCSPQLRFLGPAICPRCGKPLHLSDRPAFICNDCRGRGRSYFRNARSILLYRKPLDALVCDFKFRDQLSLIDFFGRLLRNYYPFEDRRYDLILPIPLHRKRLLWRGYNQSLLLAKAVGLRASAPVDRWRLKRVRNTRPMVGLSAAQRADNVRRAFWINPTKDLIGASVLLVDDVFTTGATVIECAKVLRRQGVRTVDVLTLMRAGGGSRQVLDI